MTHHNESGTVIEIEIEIEIKIEIVDCPAVTHTHTLFFCEDPSSSSFPKDVLLFSSLSSSSKPSFLAFLSFFERKGEEKGPLRSLQL